MDNSPTQPDDSTQTAGFPKQFFSDQETHDPQFSYPNQMNSGVLRGSLRISNTDGSYIILGAIPKTTKFGVAFFDSKGNMISADTGVTEFIYDINTSKNVMQVKKLPNGTYGFAVAATGYDVADGYTA